MSSGHQEALKGCKHDSDRIPSPAPGERNARVQAGRMGRQVVVAWLWCSDGWPHMELTKVLWTDGWTGGGVELRREQGKVQGEDRALV